MRLREIIDPDGVVISVGMAVVCDGERWRVSWLDSELIVLDRHPCRMLVGTGPMRLRGIHVLGWLVPEVKVGLEAVQRKESKGTI